MLKKHKPVTEKKEVKLAFKSRFAGLIKLDDQNSLPPSNVRLIEGEKYIEFKGLEGVYFSDKLFI